MAENRFGFCVCGFTAFGAELGIWGEIFATVLALLQHHLLVTAMGTESGICRYGMPAVWTLDFGNICGSRWGRLQGLGEHCRHHEAKAHAKTTSGFTG